MGMIDQIVMAIAEGVVEDIPVREMALRILQELREPTDAMLLRGIQHDDATYSAWQAMIDEALKET